ncbi:MAG: hypothetical protein RBU37_13750 [Myxococcota bacterium]|jgi:hypothetical protein|nr:hypothetical protein [Myxococcota bacterium]
MSQHRNLAPTLSALFAWLCVVLPGPQVKAQACEEYGKPSLLGELQEAQVDESSGLVRSQLNPGVLWTHNDSGDDARLYAFTQDARYLGRWDLIGAPSVDWEDLALGPCEAGAALRCLYIGDIGNNNRNRDNLSVIRVQEPLLDVDALLASPASENINAFEIFPFTYSDGNWDAESLLVDPLSAELYIISKVQVGSSVLYRFPALRNGEAHTLEALAQRSFGAIPILEQSTTGADFSHDGARFVVRTYAYLYVFELGEERDLPKVFEGEVLSAKVRNEDQGEAVCFGNDDVTLWTTSEGHPMPLQAYGCAEEPVLEPESEELVPDSAEPDPLEPAPDAAELEPLDELNAELAPPAPDTNPAPQSSSGTSNGCCALARVPSRSDGAALGSFLLVLSALLVRRG